MITKCFLLFLLCVGYVVGSCDRCLETNIEITLDSFDNVIEDYTPSIEELCNATYSTPKAVVECVVVATDYVFDLYTDLQSESEHSNEVHIIQTEQLCRVISACSVKCCLTDWDPEQVHLSVTLDPSEMVVSWITYYELENPTVSYWRIADEPAHNMSIHIVPAATSTYLVGGWVGVIYNATLYDLEPGTAYRYRIEGISNATYYSEVKEYHFITDITPSSLPLQSRTLENLTVPYIPGESASVVAYFGDLGTTSNSYQTALSMIQLAQNKSIQIVVAGGDLSYADGDESTWDQFMRMNEHYTNSVPFMAAPGNHENYYHFSAYNHRFFMPNEQSGSQSQQYFSFNYGKIHFITWSFEEFGGLDLLPGGKQRKWLETDLEQANLERDVRPWVVLLGHRPFYCSSDSHDCTDVAAKIRDLLEDLINRYHVDVVLEAHKHNYERTYPVYQSEATADNYENPNAPMYYVVGVGGVDKNSDFQVDQPSWSAERETKYGFLLMSAPDENTFEMVYLSKSFNVHDSATITRTQEITNWSFSH